MQWSRRVCTGGFEGADAAFFVDGSVVWDELTGLCWSRDAGLTEFPLMWREALDFVARMNRQETLGYGDWRMPSRAELMSLLCYQETRPPLPAGHPFVNVFPGWYWTSTTAAYHHAYAWYLSMAGGRLFYGGKLESYMLWPVRGQGQVPLRRQQHCYDSEGRHIDCAQSGQDGEQVTEWKLPQPRYVEAQGVVTDRWTGLQWHGHVGEAHGPVSWQEALEVVEALAGNRQRPWRLPNINELESLVDYDEARPAVSRDNPMHALKDGYWSSTTSAYEPDWAWALYLDKGAIGVGQKKGRHFHVMAVR